MLEKNGAPVLAHHFSSFIFFDVKKLFEKSGNYFGRFQNDDFQVHTILSYFIDRVLYEGWSAFVKNMKKETAVFQKKEIFSEKTPIF